jgi:hypothetical protein
MYLQLCGVDIYNDISENKVTDNDAKSYILTLVCTIYYQCAIHTYIKVGIMFLDQNICHIFLNFLIVQTDLTQNI